ncbi:MAG: NYN domain-containing protein [Planctomycetaceae bacterium]
MSNSVPRPQERVIAYIDGFNLYFGLREARLRHCYWLNVAALVGNLLKPHQQLLRTRYFTSRLSGPPAGNTSPWAVALHQKRKRQSEFLDALGSIPQLDIHLGKYLAKPANCRACGSTWTIHEEKMTDVNIATELLTDAFQDQFDTALLVSADSDLVPPVESIRRLFPAKRVVVAFPPQRSSKDLLKSASAWLRIHETTLKKSQLPDPVILPNGFSLSRPKEWK